MSANSVSFNQSAMIAGINPKQKVDVVDLSSQFPNDSKLSRKDLSNYIKTLVGVNKISSKDKKALFNFIRRSKRIGKKDVYVPDHIANSSKVENVYKGERNTFINNIVDLIQNSVLIDVEPNSKKNEKPNVDNYLRFYVPVQIGNNTFTVRITAENNSKQNIFNILNADVYDLIIDKKMPSSVLIPANMQRNIMKTTSNNSITNSSSNINPNQVTIEEMLKGVIGADGNTYYQSAYHTFYQGGNNIPRLQRKDGTFVDVVYYDNSDITDIKPLNIRKLKFQNVQNSKEIKHRTIKDVIFRNNQKLNIKNKKNRY